MVWFFGLKYGLDELEDIRGGVDLRWSEGGI